MFVESLYGKDEGSSICNYFWSWVTNGMGIIILHKEILRMKYPLEKTMRVVITWKTKLIAETSQFMLFIVFVIIHPKVVLNFLESVVTCCPMAMDGHILAAQAVEGNSVIQ